LTFDQDGVALFQKTISDENISSLRQEFSRLEFKAGARPFELSIFVTSLLSQNGCFGQAIKKLGMPNARPVRVLAFDKTPESNWNLGWHQDRVVALKEKHEVPGFQNWTMKNNRHHAEAPVEILQDMFSLRLHLDDCDATNGALKILPGSAELGKLSDSDVRAHSCKISSIICEAKLGEILAMKALTIHASEPSVNPSHRRVLHVDYCNCTLPQPLEWAL
jgi:Phytanoyl-CoA dioxygenase (PhyH)